MKRISTWMAGLAVATTPALALAHPGHGVHDPGSLAHVFLDFPHSLWTVVAAVGIVACWRMRKAQGRQEDSESRRSERD